MIHFQSVTMKYPGEKKYAVQNMSFHIAPGEFVFVTGASGSGKTTLFKLLTAENRPVSGTITACGFLLEKLKKKELAHYRRQLGVIFQDFRLISSMTVYDNLAFVRRINHVDPFLIDKQVEEMLEMLGIAEYRDKYPFQLSGGEQQRVAIGRALINFPRLILADEPTGDLDPESSHSVMNLLNEINGKEEYGSPTVVVITHEKKLVDQMRKRVIHLDHGQLISDVSRGTYPQFQGGQDL